MRFHKLQNVQIALDYLRHRQVRRPFPTHRPRPCPSCPGARLRAPGLQVKLVNIRNDDIADGNPKLTLGLIWTIILHFQVACPHLPLRLWPLQLRRDLALPAAPTQPAPQPWAASFQRLPPLCPLALSGQGPQSLPAEECLPREAPEKHPLHRLTHPLPAGLHRKPQI